MKGVSLSLLTLTLMTLGGCGEADPDAPPEIRLGDSTCIECGMIVSDERFGTATVVEGSRGSEALIFDDYNCQKNFELKHPELSILTRWSRDYETLAWFRTDDGWFVSSKQIRTPMASNIAGFGSIEIAETFSDSVNGEVITYDAYIPQD
ncbi:MAG: nitrous oxide reductase accessory protein NosL [Phycisphaerales bacterium JB047]